MSGGDMDGDREPGWKPIGWHRTPQEEIERLIEATADAVFRGWVDQRTNWERQDCVKAAKARLGGPDAETLWRMGELNGFIMVLILKNLRDVRSFWVGGNGWRAVHYPKRRHPTSYAMRNRIVEEQLNVFYDRAVEHGLVGRYFQPGTDQSGKVPLRWASWAAPEHEYSGPWAEVIEPRIGATTPLDVQPDQVKTDDEPG